MEAKDIAKEPYYLSPPYRGWTCHSTIERSARKQSEGRSSSPSHLPMHLQDHSQSWTRRRHRRPSSLSTHAYDVRSPTSRTGRQSPVPSPPPRTTSRTLRNRRPPPLAIPSPSSTSSGSRTPTPWYLTTATPRSAKTFDSWPMRSPGSDCTCMSLDTLNRNGPDYRRWSHSYYWYDNPSSSSQSSLASTSPSASRVPVHRYQPPRSAYSGRNVPGYATPIRTQHYIVRCMWTLYKLVCL